MFLIRVNVGTLASGTQTGDDYALDKFGLSIFDQNHNVIAVYATGLWCTFSKTPAPPQDMDKYTFLILHDTYDAGHTHVFEEITGDLYEIDNFGNLHIYSNFNHIRTYAQGFWKSIVPRLR